jgi:hypothetical protein
VTTYSGIDVLEIAPNHVTTWDSAEGLVVRSVDNAQGNVLTTTTSAPPSRGFSLEWACDTRAARAAVEAFLAARYGRGVQCWIPTYARDVEVSSSSALNWVVSDATLTALVAVNPRWQSWMSRSPGGATYRIYDFSSVTDLGGGALRWNGTTSVGTGSMSLTSALGGVFSRLMRCRMAGDRYRVTYLHGHATVVTADFEEVAGEL